VFTATLASYAQHAGKLSFDDHPGKFLPALKGRPIDKASLLHLATYTAGGLPLQFPFELDDAQLDDYFARWQPDSAPGVQRRYSNPSIGLLGQVSALALGTTFEQALEQLLFPQLGLKHSFVRVPDRELANYANGYVGEREPARLEPGYMDAQAFGVKATASDLLHFVESNLDPARLDATMRRVVEATQLGYFQVGDMVQGLGWEQYAYPVTMARLAHGNSPALSRVALPVTRFAMPRVASAHTLFNKSGSTIGFASYALFVPQKKIGIVFLANRLYPHRARVQAAHALLEQLGKHATATRNAPVLP
jgi:beta-lactamase class C